MKIGIIHAVLFIAYWPRSPFLIAFVIFFPRGLVEDPAVLVLIATYRLVLDTNDVTISQVGRERRLEVLEAFTGNEDRA